MTRRSAQEAQSVIGKGIRMRNACIASLLAAVGCAAPAFGQTLGSIEGTVLDAQGRNATAS